MACVSLSRFSACLGLLIMPSVGRSAETSDSVRAAIAKALPLLQKGAEGHVAQRSCFACHNQAIPLLALTIAQSRGFPLAEDHRKKQVEFVAKFLHGNVAAYREGKGQGGQVDTAGYALFALEVGAWRADATTEAVVEYLLKRDPKLDHWRTSGHRPPSEASDFSATYVALRGLQHWGAPAEAERINRRLDAVRGWLLKTKARDTEDRVFRLLGLEVACADAEAIAAAAQDLQNTQRADGGWSQTEKMTSDAYATGTALFALQQAGKLNASDPAYRRGVAFLLKNQCDDGSWHVHTRSSPFQTYFESGFPHGKDQFISMAATGWATTALALSLPPAVSTARNQPRETP